ncbi:hypothetical protein HELRODRAFT_70793 [Helobdella robusta]|uniref:Mannosyl-oligosaccharide glucosidase n=1 Tax=Helobdella robusta TaxID=6412 RepID=T1G0C2_HELRO|nr:hypothetical protein HELRODRAFT_70793 [Helobdella robusta]ESN90459.1 hypothetical protein HELRODRAFT_70793 [Helobdella robusta]
MTKKSAHGSKKQTNQKSDSSNSNNLLNNNGDKGSDATLARSVIQKKIKESRKKHSEKHESPIIFQYAVIFFLGVLTASIIGGYFWYFKFLKEIVITPFNAPRILNANSSLPINNFDRFWGSYRSGLYFGMKARSPSSPNFGIMWMSQSAKKFPPDIRHWCNQGDGLQGYGWKSHDGIGYGRHEVVDNQFIVKTDFVTKPGGAHGGDWTANIKIIPKNTDYIEESYPVSLFFYMSLDHDSGQLAASTVGDRLVGIRGRSEDLGSFQVSHKVEKKFVENILLQNFLITRVPTDVGDLKQVVQDNFKVLEIKNTNTRFLALRGINMPEGVDVSKANFIINQITSKLPFEIDVLYESGSVAIRPEKLTGDVFTNRLLDADTDFVVRFETTFRLSLKNFSQSEIEFARSTFSNLLGGIGYFYGSSLVKSNHHPEPLPYWEAPLYTAVPSRSFFPRGFLWDEGFHNLLISQWDFSISEDIISHWLDLMNVEGWIPREQILGPEARARVPDEFVVQNNENANPPTFFLPLEKIAKRVLSFSLQSSFSLRRDKLFLERIFPRLTAWYQWFNRTQHSEKTYSAFYWRGRNATTDKELNPKTLTSGLDDYPRASHPSDDERHLDLRCWMAYASKVMQYISKILDYDAFDKEFGRMYKLLSDNALLNKLHWSSTRERYSDYGLHTNHVELKTIQLAKTLKPGQYPPQRSQIPAEKIRVVTSEPTLGFVDSEFGYVSLFPFLLKILEPSSIQLKKILNDLPNPDLLWTSYGLRSLARTSPMYKKFNTEHDAPYWRGPIWININYLAVSALHYYAYDNVGPFSSIAVNLYHDLRENLISNIHKQYLKTGYVWEQYDDVIGLGKGSHPFTGWTSLIVLIMAEQY